MENGLTASDVALMTNDGMGGWNGMIWLFAILALMGGGFGGWGNNDRNFATQEFVQNGFNFNDLQDQNRDLMQAITSGTAQSVAATNQTFHDTVNALQDKYSELQRDIAGVALHGSQIMSNQNECCCSTKMEIAQNRYEAALNTAAINEKTTEQTQKILDALAQNKIEALQAKVNELELKNATDNVVRYPSNWTYNAGMSPFCGCQGCGM
jgi:hypothetical protein